MSSDEIEIRRLEVPTHVGVPDLERADAQSVWISVIMRPAQGLANLADDISNTIDYQQVADDIAAIAKSKPRRLIETLADEISSSLLCRYPITSIEITVEKQILPETDFVAVRIARNAPGYGR